jgi:hypothetical protein
VTRHTERAKQTCDHRWVAIYEFGGGGKIEGAEQCTRCGDIRTWIELNGIRTYKDD